MGLHLQHTEKKKKKIGKPVCEIPIFYHLVVLRFRVGFATHTHTEKKRKKKDLRSMNINEVYGVCSFHWAGVWCGIL